MVQVIFRIYRDKQDGYVDKILRLMCSKYTHTYIDIYMVTRRTKHNSIEIQYNSITLFFSHETHKTHNLRSSSN